MSKYIKAEYLEKILGGNSFVSSLPKAEIETLLVDRAVPFELYKGLPPEDLENFMYEDVYRELAKELLKEKAVTIRSWRDYDNSAWRYEFSIKIVRHEDKLKEETL